MTRVIAIDPLDPDAGALREAADLLRAGGLVAYPTDTAYGLGADARDPEAVDRVVRAKGRDAGRAMPVLIGEAADLDEIAAPLPGAARMLVERFWPGALTLALPALPAWRHMASADGRIGVRLPAHAVPRALARLLGGPIVGTSANRSGETTPRDAAGVVGQLAGRVDLVLDGGALRPSRGSTVLTWDGDLLRLVREGDLPLDAVRDALADLDLRIAIGGDER
jgi:L-threonylcarbamoyladenylate synthase